MIQAIKKYRFLALLMVATMALFVGYKVIAQSTTVPPIDFDNGPLVAQNQPSNIVLALSVEFPTSGGAYKEPDNTYIDRKEYLGYFNSRRCYTYPGYDGVTRTASFNANTDYFSPTGDTDSNFYCNVSGAGTGFSGNYLNFATMSAPDILRLALTGGDRGIDEHTRTVLDRGTIAPTGSAPFRRAVGATVTGVVTPFTNNVIIYAFNCNDQVIFTTNSTKGCDNPNLADATDLRPVIVSDSNPSATTTTTPTIAPIEQLGTTWTDTNTLTTTVPTLGPVMPRTLYTTTQVLSDTVFSCPTSPCQTESGVAIDIAIKSYTQSGTATTPATASLPTVGSLPIRTIQGYYWTGATSTTAPITAAENPAVIRGYVPNGTQTTTVAPIPAAENPPAILSYFWNGSATTTVAPVTAAESPAVIRGYVWTSAGYNVFSYQGGGAPNTPATATRTHYVCYDTAAPNRIRVGPQNANPTCAAGQTKFQYTSNTATSRQYWPYYTQGAEVYRSYLPVYKLFRPFYYVYAPFYNSYTPNYWLYTSYIKYRVLYEQAVWKNYARTGKAVVKPRPLVCDSVEGPTRLVVYGTGAADQYNFCKKYEFAGVIGYKPEGQVQQKSEQARISVMSYLLDNDGGRYGGVLRAPMKYVGPNKYDSTGSLITNPEKEWEITTGVFIAKPITDSVSTAYTNTGVINYLNKFGKTGNYKTFDAIGELWYESLRYLQGLAPTAESTVGMTEPMKDAFPVYETWVDPVTSACQRSNYILGIGDTNTHWDRSLPGITVAEQTAMDTDNLTYDFAYYQTPTINGSATALNAHDWTKILDAFERSGATALPYIDSLGRSRTTAGNPAPTTGLSNLDTRTAGSSGRSSYHWAGLAYWANTQAIRTDVKGGASMSDVRVKTFMIDVDENNRGTIDANIKSTAYYQAGKYGYFDDKAQTGSPFTDSGGTQWADATGAPNGYVLASQPQRLVGGIAKFFNDAGGGGNSFATVAVSSNSLSAASPNGQTFEPSFTPGEWGGTVKSIGLGLNTATNTLVGSTSTVWDAGAILTSASRDTGAVTLPKVRPDQRKIVTYIAATTPRAVSFTYAATSDAADLPASFNKTPYTTIVDNQAEARINYLRGDRTKELDETFRPRQNILGDIINSGPVYKAGANPDINGVDYPAFEAAKKTRTPVVYTGSNDGMLHAFKADTGQELFAYVPSGVLETMPNLTSKQYLHKLYVDAVPSVDEVRTSAGWRTVLASGMGGGAQGIFALDVTDPTNFSTANVMFEFTDLDDPAMGNVTSQPQFVKMLVPGTTPASYKYYIVVSSGYNNYKNDGSGRYTLLPDQALFFLDVNKAIGTPWAEGTNYFKVLLPAADPTKANGLAQPAVRLGNAREGVDFFAGDLQGNVWKISFPAGLNSTKVATAVRKNGSSIMTPLFTAKDSAGNAQPITSSPVVTPYQAGGNMVVFGTGRLLETTDRTTTTTQAVYGVWDSGLSNAASYNLLSANLSQNTVNSSTLAVTGSTATFSMATGAKRGWYFNFTRAKERIVIDPVTTAGVVQFSSTIPPSSQCTDNGNSLVYYLNPSTGFPVTGVEGDTGYFGKGLVIDIDISGGVGGGGGPTSSYSDRTVAGSRTATMKKGILVPGQDGKKIIKYFDVKYLQTGRVYWREVRDFNLVTQY